MKKAKNLAAFISFGLLLLILFLGACNRKNGQSTSSISQSSTQKEESPSEKSVKERLSLENELRGIAQKTDSIVPLEIKSKRSLGRCTGFFVDTRGYFVTARHCFSTIVPNQEDVIVFLGNNKNKTARLVGEIQTMDLAILSIDEPVPFSAVSFADVTKIFDGNSPVLPNIKLASGADLRERLVVVRCVSLSDSSSPSLDRIFIGELGFLDAGGSTITIVKLPQDTSGCSGTPVLNVKGEAVGMLRARSVVDNYMQFAVDANTVRYGAKLIIEEDVKSRTDKK